MELPQGDGRGVCPRTNSGIAPFSMHTISQRRNGSGELLLPVRAAPTIKFIYKLSNVSIKNKKETIGFEAIMAFLALNG